MLDQFNSTLNFLLQVLDSSILVETCVINRQGGPRAPLAAVLPGKSEVGCLPLHVVLLCLHQTLLLQLSVENLFHLEQIYAHPLTLLVYKLLLGKLKLLLTPYHPS